MKLSFTPFFLAALFLLAPIAKAETAIFAGGCFWCVEKDLDKVKGVISTTSGFAGGTAKNPTYENHEGYTEAVKVEFDPKVISYKDLTRYFLRTIDVLDGDGQFCDRGPSYIPALFPLGPAQTQAAQQALKEAAQALKQDIKVKISNTANFAAAEDYHQDYYKSSKRILTRFGVLKKSDAYKNYREACGRDARVKALWGKEAYDLPKGGS